MRVALLLLLGVLLAPLLAAQKVPVGAEGKIVLTVKLAVEAEGRVFDRAPESATRHAILGNLRTREQRPFKAAELAQDLKLLTEKTHLFRKADYRIELDQKLDGVRVTLILTQPIVMRVRMVAPLRGAWSEAAVAKRYRFIGAVDTSVGSEFSIRRLNEDVKRLNDTRAFLDVRSEYEYTSKGVDVLLRVIQNEPLAGATFSGIYATGFRSDLIKLLAGKKAVRETPTRGDSGALLSPRYISQAAFEFEVTFDADASTLVGAANQIRAWYRARGYPFVEVTPRLINLPLRFDRETMREDYGELDDLALDAIEETYDEGVAGKLILLFQVYEGPRVLVGDLKFKGLDGIAEPPGSDAFSASRITGMLSMFSELWYGLPVSTDVAERAAVLKLLMRQLPGEPFVQDDLARDAETVQSYLQDRGWREARVTFLNWSLNHRRNRANLTFKISPGPLYAVTDIRFELATRAPRVPKGAEQPAFDKPIASFQELMDEMDVEGVAWTREKAVDRYGAEYVTPLDNQALGRHFRALVLTEPIPYDNYRILGDPTDQKPGMSGRIRALYAERGYSNIELEFVPVYEQSSEVETDWGLPTPVRPVSLIVRINQGYESITGSVTFRGNDTTRDDVIRRLVTSYPGERFDRNKLERSTNRLRLTGWFEQAAPGAGVLNRTTPRLVEMDDHVIEYTDIEFELIEGRTGSFNFVAGFNTALGFTVAVDVSLNNFDISSLVSWAWGDPNFSFTGAGQRFSLSAQPPIDRQQRYAISFSEPWLWGYPVSGGIQGEFKVTDFGQYTQSRAGVDPSFGWRVLPDVLLSTGYSYSVVRLFDISSNAPQVVKEDQGTDVLSTLFAGVAWDTRDNRFFATTGWQLNTTYSFTGGFLGGTVDYWRLRANAEYYLPVAEIDSARKLVLAFRVRGTWQETHSGASRIPFGQKLFLGGNSIAGQGLLRGYAFQGVGPSRNGDPIGGNFRINANAELRFPVLPGRLWIVGFVDVGELSSSIRTFDGSGFTVSAGVGLRLILPILPVPFALDFGFPIIHQPGNNKETLSINLGFGF